MLSLNFNNPTILKHYWIYCLTGITSPEAQKLIGERSFDYAMGGYFLSHDFNKWLQTATYQGDMDTLGYLHQQMQELAPFLFSVVNLLETIDREAYEPEPEEVPLFEELVGYGILQKSDKWYYNNTRYEKTRYVSLSKGKLPWLFGDDDKHLWE